MTLKPFNRFRALSWRTLKSVRTNRSISTPNAQARVWFLVVAALLLASCGGGDEDTVATTGAATPGNTQQPTDPSLANFGTDGQPAFRLRGNNNGFDLVEGDTITIPVTIDRVNEHSETVEVSLELVDAPDDLLVSALDRAAFQPGQTQGTLNATFLHGRQRTIEQQRTIVVTATDGVDSSQIEVVLNIRPTTLPDIYLLAGQSNMVGFSEFNAKDISPGGPDEPNPLIEQLNVTANDTVTFDSVTQFGNPEAQTGFPDFAIAEDPLHTSSDPSLSSKVGTMVGMGLTFAKRALVNDGNHRIVLVPAAWSSTGFCNTGEFLSSFSDGPDFIADGELGWNAFPQTDPVFGGTTLFERAVLRTNIAIQRKGGILRGILWHQGESDGDNAVCAAAYAENLATMVSELRTRIIVDARGPDARGAASDVPFIAGTMSRGTDPRGDFSFISNSKQIVDNVHRNIGAEGVIPHYGVAILDDIIPANGFPCGEGSCVHYGSEAYREIGIRYFETLQDLLNTPQ